MEPCNDFFKTLRKHFRFIQKKVVKEEHQPTLDQNNPDKDLILDTGQEDEQFARIVNKTGGPILCLDIHAKKRRNPENDYIPGSGESLPFKKGVFDFMYYISVLLVR